MKTTIEKVFTVDQPIDKVWSFLADPTQVVTCVPGASITEKVDENNYKGKVGMKFGPVSVKYNGEVSIQELNEADKEMKLKGRGLDSRGKGSADMLMNGKLTEIEGGTEVKYSMEVSVNGMLAQFGARLINDVTDQVVNQFINNFKAKLSGDAPAADSSAGSSLNAASLMGNVVKSKLGGLFGGKKDEADS